MYNHKPSDYTCPFCRIAEGTNTQRLPEVIYEDDQIMSFISRDWWPNNPGHVLIVPKVYIENIYDLPYHLSDRIYRFARCVALALKAIHQCDGISTRQHNEPAGNQDVWHYHLHVFPRYTGDNLYREKKAEAPYEERVRHAEKLRTYFEKHVPNIDNP